MAKRTDIHKVLIIGSIRSLSDRLVSSIIREHKHVRRRVNLVMKSCWLTLTLQRS